MNRLDIESYASEKTAIRILDSRDGAVLLKFSGTIDHPNPGEFLDPLLEKVHLRALERKIPKVEADFTDLGFLNSSGIKSLIKWILRHTELAGQERYGIKLVYSAKVTWQETNMKAIAYLTKGAVIAEPI